MKIIVAVLLLALPVFSQDPAKTERAAAGCGPDDVQFDVKTDKNPHPIAQPESGKALVYVIQDMKGTCIFCSTYRVGMDGAWMGANKGSSYFYFPADPGDHHICTFDSGKRSAAADLAAEAGKTYFFRAKVENRPDRVWVVKLEPVDNSEGQLLVAGTKFSTSHQKK